MPETTQHSKPKAMSEPSHRLTDINQTRLSVYEWHKEHRDQKPTIVMVHATGFHARCWDQLIEHFTDHHIIALDQRGHGQSLNTGFASWLTFAEDLRDLLGHLNIKGAIGLGHSMGGHICTMTSALQDDLFAQLILLDPVIFSPQMYQHFCAKTPPPASEHVVAKRRNHFISINDAVERYQARPPFNVFTDKALMDYCQHGLVASDNNNYQLACPPQTEAQIYQTAFSNPLIIDVIETIHIPVTVVRSMQAASLEEMQKDFRYSPTWPELASKFPNGKDVLLDDLTHFLPMQAPSRIAKLIKKEMDEA